MTGHFARSGKIVIGVAGEIHEGGFVRGGFVVETELVVIGHGVGDAGGEVSGVAFFAVLAEVGEADGGGVFGGGKGLGLPDDLAKTFDSAMNVVRAGVGGELVFHAVEGETGVGDSICHAANDGGGGIEAVQIAVKIVG